MAFCKPLPLKQKIIVSGVICTILSLLSLDITMATYLSLIGMDTNGNNISLFYIYISGLFIKYILRKMVSLSLADQHNAISKSFRNE